MDPTWMKQFLEEQQRQQAEMMEMFAEAKISVPSTHQPSTVVPSIDSCINSIPEFHYRPDEDVTFETWFKRYGDIFTIELASQDDATRVRILLCKLGATEMERYCNLILPQQPRDRTFDETVQSLKSHFDDKTSLFSKRYQCFTLAKDPSTSFSALLTEVKRLDERAKFKVITDNQFLSLILISSLQSSEDADIRLRLLNRLDVDPDLSLEKMDEECTWISRIQSDNKIIQQGDKTCAGVHALHQTSQRGPQRLSAKPLPINTMEKTAKYPCWRCMDKHFPSLCPHKRNKCQSCKRIGHKTGFCKGNPSFENYRPKPNYRQKYGNNHETARVSTVFQNKKSPIRLVPLPTLCTI